MLNKKNTLMIHFENIELMTSQLYPFQGECSLSPNDFNSKKKRKAYLNTSIHGSDNEDEKNYMFDFDNSSVDFENCNPINDDMKFTPFFQSDSNGNYINLGKCDVNNPSMVNFGKSLFGKSNLKQEEKKYKMEAEEQDTNSQTPIERLSRCSVSTSSTKKFANDKSKDYNKNICRYIARLVVRMFCDLEFKADVLRVSTCTEAEYKIASKFFLDRIEEFSGHRAFADYLTIFNDDPTDVKMYKRIFKRFAKWFLRERAVRYILKGDAKDKMAYIRYKNDIMLYYINKPETWVSNKIMK